MYARARVSVKLGENAHVPVEKPQPEARPGDRRELFGDPEVRHDPVDLTVEVDRPRLRIDALPALEYQALDTVLGQQRGGGQSGRPGTDDDDRDDPFAHRIDPNRTTR